MIWFNLTIPLIAIIVMLVFFRKKMAIWEYGLIFLIPLIAIFIGKYSSIHSQTEDTEFWNFYLTHAEYTEYWSTWDHEICTESYACGTDKDRNTKYCTRTYDCSHCDEHSATWIAYDNGGNSYSISKDFFEYLCKEWGNRKFVELNRHIVKHWGCGKDGDKYVTNFNGVFEKIKPVLLKKTYENRIQCSKTLFNFSEVDSIDSSFYGLYDYPNHNNMFNYNPILGWKDRNASTRLFQWNGLLGSSKKVHMLILVYKNKPQQAALYQESLWKKGNKNEFILCIGLNNENKIDWTHVISWTDQEKLKIEVRDSVARMDFNLVNIVDYMAKEVRSNFVKKSFKDFSYISVEPTSTAVMITFIVVILLTVGVCIFSVFNDIDSDGRKVKNLIFIEDITINDE